MKTKLITGILVLALLATAISLVSAHNNRFGPAPTAVDGDPIGPGWCCYFEDEDGDGFCDHWENGHGYWHGHGFRWFAPDLTPDE